MSESKHRYCKILSNPSMTSRCDRESFGSRTTLCRNLFCWLFFALFFLHGAAFAARDGAGPHVLVLHSYHPGFEWTDRVMAGIRAGFEEEGLDAELTVEYMDTKFNPPETVFPHLVGLYQDKYRDFQPDAVVSSDNNAFEFLLQNRQRLFPGVPVVFCGVNDYTDALIENQKDITGVAEDFDMKGTLNLALGLHPNTRQIVIVSDDTRTAKATLERMRKSFSEYEGRVDFVELTNLSAGEYLSAFYRLPKDSLVVLNGLYRDRFGRTFSRRDCLKFVAGNSPVPVYSLWENMIDCGVLGGVVVNGHSQGFEAAKMAARILRGEPASDIAVLRKSPNVPMFDYEALDKFEMKKSSLPEGSVIVNAPESFYYRHKALIWSAVGLVLLLLSGILVLSVNIARRKQTEKALKKSEERFRSIFENLMDVYFRTTLDGIAEEISPSFQVASGYRNHELIGTSVFKFYQKPSDRKRLIEEIERKGKVRDYEVVFKNRNGEPYDVSINADLICDENGKPTGLSGTIRDITERKRLEEKLRRSQKMESLGLMASGIAHDLNNILSGIVSYPDLLLLDLPEDSPMRKSIEIIQDSGQRAADVVADLLTVAKGAVANKEVHSLNTIVEEFFESVEFRSLERKHPMVAFEKDLNAELPNIRCSSPHMKKVLTNLVSNAAEAIQMQGEVAVKTGDMYLDEALKGYENISKGEYVLLSVSDTGKGISEKDIDRIFEPFYTKKVMGRNGTGLGLAVVWNTVQDHNGYIHVKSGAKGAVFELYFPVDRNEVAARKSKVPLADYGGNGEDVLVVDDEIGQREIACGLLERLGYKTRAVQSGEEAIEYLKRNPVDLVVLDMIMPPGLNGCETYAEIVKLRPGQKAVIASGFSETEDVKAAQRLGAGAYIKKPYTIEKIGLAVRNELKRSTETEYACGRDSRPV